jgi:hypothetical protein
LDNYKEHLLTFSDEERQQLFAVLNGERGQRRVAEAVDLIMRARNSADAVKLVALILSGRRNAA